MKDKVLKILFIISFLPILLILLFGIGSIFFGFYTFFGNTLYGIDAFLVEIMIIGGFLSPLLLICLVYQRWYMKKDKKDTKDVDDLTQKMY